MKTKKKDDDRRFYAALGSRIREARMARGVSQNDLGVGLGVTFQQVQKYESGENRIPVSHLLRVAKRFEVSVTQLLDTVE